MSKATRLSLADALSRVTFLPDRRPDTPSVVAAPAFATLSEYRDGAIYVGHYAGFSEWERHRAGDEVVHVLGGRTVLVLLESGGESRHALAAGELFVVPRGLWHRFESPDGVQVMTITPQPTDHAVDRPEVDELG